MRALLRNNILSGICLIAFGTGQLGCSDRENSGPSLEADSGRDTGADADTDADSDSDADSDVEDTCSRDLDDLGIMEVPSGFNVFEAEGFVKYTEHIAPNGKPIRIFAQDKVSDLALYRARSLLEFFLSDAPGTNFGSDKTAVANTMADNEAILIMPNGADGEGAEPQVFGQPLYENETPVEGSRWYMENDYEHRDAAFEEIFHLVHDFGIGTYMPGALPEYQQALVAEAEEALDDGRWGIPIDPEVNNWIEELRQEGSLAQEYIASVIDSYYGLWGPWTEDAGGMWGIYIAKTRDEVANRDPDGMALLESFLPPYITYEVRIDPQYDGSFSMTFDETQPYTHKSRYLLNATLTGANNAGLIGNERDNRLRGNSGDNTLDGREGDDTAVFKGSRDEYTVTHKDDSITVSDNVSDRDGADTLVNMEFVEFCNGSLPSDSFGQ